MIRKYENKTVNNCLKQTVIGIQHLKKNKQPVDVASSVVQLNANQSRRSANPRNIATGSNEVASTCTTKNKTNTHTARKRVNQICKQTKHPVSTKLTHTHTLKKDFP